MSLFATFTPFFELIMDLRKVCYIKRFFSNLLLKVLLTSMFFVFIFITFLF